METTESSLKSECNKLKSNIELFPFKSIKSKEIKNNRYSEKQFERNKRHNDDFKSEYSKNKSNSSRGQISTLPLKPNNLKSMENKNIKSDLLASLYLKPMKLRASREHPTIDYYGHLNRSTVVGSKRSSNYSKTPCFKDSFLEKRLL